MLVGGLVAGRATPLGTVTTSFEADRMRWLLALEESTTPAVAVTVAAACQPAVHFVVAEAATWNSTKVLPLVNAAVGTVAVIVLPPPLLPEVALRLAACEAALALVMPRTPTEPAASVRTAVARSVPRPNAVLVRRLRMEIYLLREMGSSRHGPSLLHRQARRRVDRAGGRSPARLKAAGPGRRC